jgi:hypothetical protein
MTANSYKWMENSRNYKDCKSGWIKWLRIETSFGLLCKKIKFWVPIKCSECFNSTAVLTVYRKYSNTVKTTHKPLKIRA